MKSVFFITIILLVNFCFSQGEANNWYFGQNAAITFNGGAPVGLTNSAMVSFEGCSTISDSNGNLLFYSDGISVWNRNHTIMPNGTGLLGDPSSTQSGIVVPHPGNSDLFYLFSLDEVGLPNGLRYSIVDMSLDNGFGDVTSSKNVLLHTPSTEKITAITHANGNDIWVVTHKYLTNEFFTYLIDNTGINSTPLITALGFRPITTSDAIGSIKISPDGRKIAVVYGNEGLVEIFDFDTSTGLISNLIQIPGFRTSISPTLVYGVEFSPNGDHFSLRQAPNTASNKRAVLPINTKREVFTTIKWPVTNNYSGNPT
jgi:WD40 repeat protein